MLEKGNKTIKTNWFIVAPIVLGLIVFFEWYVTNTNYQQAVNQHRARKRAKTKAFSASSTTPPSSPRRKKMDKKASKSKLAQESGASAAEEEDFVIIGADGKRILPYSFKRSIIVETIRGANTKRRFRAHRCRLATLYIVVVSTAPSSCTA